MTRGKGKRIYATRKNRLLKPIDELTGCDLRATAVSMDMIFDTSLNKIVKLYDNLPIADKGLERNLKTWHCDWCGVGCAGVVREYDGFKFCSSNCVTLQRQTFNYKTDRTFIENF